MPRKPSPEAAALQREASRRWKEKNREAYLASRRAKYAEDPEPSREKSRQRRKAKADSIRAYRRVLYETKQKQTNAAAVKDYRRRNPGKQAEIENRRRARFLAAFVAPVEPDAIWIRDAGICQLCMKPVERNRSTLDHIVPLSRGGTHEPTNVQLAHGPCNSRKGDRIIQREASA